MIYNYLKSIIIIFILLTGSALYAETVDISKNEKVSLLEHSSIFIGKKDLPLKTIIRENKFQPFHDDYLNLGISKGYIYIHFRLLNPTEKPITKALIAHSPLLENITLYVQNDLDKGQSRGIMHLDDTHITIPYYFTISIAPRSTKDYYLKVHSSIRTVGFSLTIDDKEKFLEHDRKLQAVDMLFIGMVMALMFYSFFLSYFISDRSYFFYGSYLLMLLYQQSSYLGLIQLYTPKWFIVFDTHMIIMKISLLLISAALFAIYFLEIKRYPWLHKIYFLIIGISFIQIMILDPYKASHLLTAILVSTVYIFFNLYAGIYVYRRGLKQARLFIVGVGLVSLLYIVMLLDVLGMVSLMRYFNSLLLFGTALEAFILSLAFADRYLILQAAKEKADTRILLESKNRASIVEQEVLEKTKELNQALETKELLIKEIHHRVKNNLQLILSIIRLQNDEIDDIQVSQKLSDLESRINAIATTYSMLLENASLEEIDMKIYLDNLLLDISEYHNYLHYRIDIHTDIDAGLPIKESVYVGLIVNELVTNSYKYAFPDGKGSIDVKLHEEKNHYTLIVEDSGDGFEPDANNKSLGLKLIHTLVYDQLGGNMELFTSDHTKYIIKFAI
ncbi:7TM diverse intracellular signaling domain-containing protein [Sulfurovum lithotrophicum]|uniref:7TM diverse intracellular signaling domain-containing protein n=1 Tax=Sulfurovum lithotrophicum TaxID=206403 RepID=UPI0006979E32|nr:7TM diverse intracellular signaling domain-containing protein [Sulfurovum lithotrophicum]